MKTTYKYKLKYEDNLKHEYDLKCEDSLDYSKPSQIYQTKSTKQKKH